MISETAREASSTANLGMHQNSCGCEVRQAATGSLNMVVS